MTWEIIRGIIWITAIGIIAGSTGAWAIYKLFLKNAQIRMQVVPDWKEITQYIAFPEPISVRIPRDDYIKGIEDFLNNVYQYDFYSKRETDIDIHDLIKIANNHLKDLGQFIMVKDEPLASQIPSFEKPYKHSYKIIFNQKT